MIITLKIQISKFVFTKVNESMCKKRGIIQLAVFLLLSTINGQYKAKLSSLSTFPRHRLFSF